MSIFRPKAHLPVPAHEPVKPPENHMSDPLALIYQIALQDHGKSEDGTNRGAFVDSINKESGADLGSPWCAGAAGHWIRKAAKQLGKTILIKLTPSVMQMAEFNNSKIEHAPFEGALCLMEHGESYLGHCGIVGPVNADGSFPCCEGNTSSNDPAERNGGEVAIHTRKVGVKYGNLHIVGFLRAF